MSELTGAAKGERAPDRRLTNRNGRARTFFRDPNATNRAGFDTASSSLSVRSAANSSGNRSPTVRLSHTAGRYSELRATEPAGLRRVEMFAIGG